ncbi:MAG: transrane protease protein [Pseudomonadota bacterium]
MIHRLRRFFSIGDPRWGRGPESQDNENANDSSGRSNGRGPSDSDSNESDNDRQSPFGQGNRQGPRRPNDGPPDLDEVWRDFNRRLSGLFGGKKGGQGGGPRNPWGNNGGGGGGGSGPSLPSFNVNPPMIIALLVGLILIWLASGFYIVQEGRASLVLRFGEYKYSSGAGFNWRLPYPIEEHELVDIAQLRQATVGYRGERGAGQARDSLMLTRDENMIELQFAVQYRVGNPEQYLFNNTRPDDIVVQAAETAMREVVGRSIADAVLYENKEAIGREVLNITQRIADRYESGLSIVNVTIQNVQPPEEVQAAFNDAIKAAQDAERVKNEGQAYANDVIPRARGAADRLIEEAEGYRERLIATSQGDAERFTRVVTEYAKAPAVTRERLYLETMQEVFSNVSKVIVDSKSNSNLLYLPLDKILQQTSAEAQRSAAAAISNMTTPGNTSPSTIPVPGGLGAPAASGASLRDRFREAR